MEILKKIDRKFFDTYGYQDSKLKNYVSSPYVIKHEYKDKILLFNSLTTEIITMDKDETLSEIFLRKHWFKLDSELDSFTIAKLFKTIRYDKDIIRKTSMFVIFTTMTCNARCPYCFENGRENKHPMSNETAEKVGDFIVANKEKISINWFGGEPLVNPSAIRIITEKLRNNNIIFSSNITTNGYLVDKFSINELKYKWNTSNVQITIDGDEEEYNSIKNYIHKDTNPFKKVVDNIFYLSKNGIHVAIRFNVSLENYASIRNVIEKIRKDNRFNKNITMYCAKLTGDWISEEDDKILSSYELDTNKYLNSLDILQVIPRFINYYQDYCLADSGICKVINVDGKIGFCEHYSDNEDQLSDVEDSVFELSRVEPFRAHRKVEACNTCPLYPTCRLADVCEILTKCTKHGVDYNINLCKLYLEKFFDNYLKNNDNPYKVTIL